MKRPEGRQIAGIGVPIAACELWDIATRPPLWRNCGTSSCFNHPAGTWNENGDPTSFRQVFKAQTGLNSPPIDRFADLHSRGLNHLLRILFLVALFRLRAFLVHLSKHFRHVLDLVPNIKTYVDRGALLSRHRYTIAGPCIYLDDLLLLRFGLDQLPKTHRLRQPSIRGSPSNERNPWLVWTQLLIARVVLFDDVIQVETGSTSAPTPQFLLPLEFRDHFLV